MFTYLENLAGSNKPLRRLLPLAVIAALIWAWALWPRTSALRVTFLDVRQGDCALIQTPGGKTVLIDAGGGGGYDVGSRVVAPFLRRNGIRDLDLVVMTHPHEDHIGGMPGVLENEGVERIMDCGVAGKSEAYDEVTKAARERGIGYIHAHRGQRVSFPDGVTMDVLSPGNEPLGGESDLNDNSVVLRLKYRDVSFIFAGDAGSDEEEDILRNCRDLRSTALKVAHHGSNSATSELWLRAVRPRVAIISVGRNNQFHLPSPSTLSRLAAVGARVFRTDRDGGITVTTDGTKMDVATTR